MAKSTFFDNAAFKCVVALLLFLMITYGKITFNNFYIRRWFHMEKHFCTCPDLKCPAHPKTHDKGCDPCIKKNLEFGEIPACFWGNVSNVTGTTDYSAKKFAEFVIKKQEIQ